MVNYLKERMKWKGGEKWWRRWLSTLFDQLDNHSRPIDWEAKAKKQKEKLRGKKGKEIGDVFLN